mmetsp:Transcript_24744/g.37604  ORF Transcript_24744/g.37604 Transcript_24744/m.37604 type:complete len:337 (-) Transcript_24744:296-1306(-)
MIYWRVFFLALLFARMNSRKKAKALRATPAQLCKSVRETLSQSPTLWNIVLPGRLSSIVAEEGHWLANNITSCVAQVTLPSPGRGRINLFHSGKETENERDKTMQFILQSLVDILIEANRDTAEDKNDTLSLSFNALDRKLLPILQHSLEKSHNFVATYNTSCGMWVCVRSSNEESLFEELKNDLPKGVFIRPLCQDDADLINECWEYKGDSSLQMIQKMILASEETFGGCVGLTVDGKLVSWVCRYLDGTIGMLFTKENYRKKGYAAWVLMAAVSSIRTMSNRQSVSSTFSDERLVSYIVDSNKASQRLYQKLGWVRVSDAVWCAFETRNIESNK